MDTDTLRTALTRWALYYSPRPAPWVIDGRQDPAAMHLWVEVLGVFDAEVVNAALATARDRWRDWPPSLNEVEAVTRDTAREVRAHTARTRGLIGSPADSCDGSGWVFRLGYGIPCQHCNPFLFAEWQDGHLSDHDPDRDLRLKTWSETHTMPPPCVPIVGPPIDTAEGRELADQIAEAVRAGRADLAEAADARAAEEEPW